MSSQQIPYVKTQMLPKLLNQVLLGNPQLGNFYGNLPKIESFAEQISSKKKTFSAKNRQILVKGLHKQYNYLSPDDYTKMQIDSLKDNQTFTVTTGHQLNLMGGAIFFIYKIISVINLANELQKKYPKNKFVPIFWMASEDHDFNEINHFNVGDEKLQWLQNAKGPVGRFSTRGLVDIYKKFSIAVKKTPYGKELKDLFNQSYISSKNLADATRCLVHNIFGKEGIVIIDGDESIFKSLFVSHIKNELIDKLSFNSVTKTNNKIKNIDKNFKIQVNPRSINLFYMKDNIRQRIVENEGIFQVLNTSLNFTLDDLIKEIDKYPARFSPNVLMRPIYQECILPNLSYTGGSNELSYWLQLKSYFDTSKVCFPILMHRNSAIIVSKKHLRQLKKLNLQVDDLFLSKDDLKTKIAKNYTKQNIDFSSLKNYLKKQFEDLYTIAKQTDSSFLGAVSAQEKKQINGLSKLEKRLLKAEKNKYSDHIEKALSLQKTLFPNGNLQERSINFSSFYAIHGHDFIQKLKSEMEPFQQSLSIISL